MKVQSLHRRDWNRENLQITLERFAQKKVLIVGDVGIDRYVEGRVERISPEAPVPILSVDKEWHKLGLASNVADNVQALGGDPRLVSVIGGDVDGHEFTELCRLQGISPDHLVLDPTRRTCVKERLISGQQQMLRVDYETVSPVSVGSRERVLQQVQKILPKVEGVILEDYQKGLVDPGFSQKLVQQIRTTGKVLWADPNPRASIENYVGVDGLTPNTHEAEVLSDIKIVDEVTLLQAGQRIHHSTQCKYLIITRGKEGMAVFDFTQNLCTLIPTEAREVFDVSGAGDTVIATLVLALTAGSSLVDAALLATVAAGIEVGKRGTATVAPEEIRSVMG